MKYGAAASSTLIITLFCSCSNGVNQQDVLTNAVNVLAFAVAHADFNINDYKKDFRNNVLRLDDGRMPISIEETTRCVFKVTVSDTPYTFNLNMARLGTLRISNDRVRVDGETGVYSQYGNSYNFIDFRNSYKSPQIIKTRFEEFFAGHCKK